MKIIQFRIFWSHSANLISTAISHNFITLKKFVKIFIVEIFESGNSKRSSTFTKAYKLHRQSKSHASIFCTIFLSFLFKYIFTKKIPYKLFSINYTNIHIIQQFSREILIKYKNFHYILYKNRKFSPKFRKFHLKK